MALPLLGIIGYIIFIILEILFALFAFIYSTLALYSSFMGSAYVPTKNKEVDAVLKEARLKKGQIFMDLGCGDGRVVRQAVKNFKVKGIGIDINPILILICRIKAHFSGLIGVKFSVENIMNADFSRADVIYIFLMPKFIEKLAPKLKSQTKKGALIISHGFKIIAFNKKLVKTIHHLPFPTYFYKL